MNKKETRVKVKELRDGGMDTRQIVKELDSLELSTERIAYGLQISTTSVGAYKAHNTRAEQKASSPSNSNPKGEKGLEQYVGSDYVIVPTDQVVGKLNERELTKFTTLLDKIFATEGKPQRVEKATELTKDQIKGIVHGAKDAGVANDEIYEDKRLVGVSRTSITSYIAHWSRNN
tara:strand:+ start:35291 stop:35815 length:525 start_codon:yes stop_codon:yes gene_type:complete